MEASEATMKRLGRKRAPTSTSAASSPPSPTPWTASASVFYKVNLELINIESNEKVWIGDKQIKKVIEQSKRKL
jgi:hypothetical protein